MKKSITTFLGGMSVFLACLGCGRGTDGAPSERTPDAALGPRSMASIGWWRGWFDQTDDHFAFRVYNDKIYDTQYSASTSSSICAYMYIDPTGGGSALQGNISNDAFAFDLGDTHVAGTFKDPTRAEVIFTNVNSACAIVSGKSYSAFWIEDPCGAGVPSVDTIYTGTVGGTKELAIQVFPVDRSCTAGKVADGTLVNLSIVDTDGTGTVFEQPTVGLVGGAATAKLLFGKKGRFKYVVKADGIAPSFISETVTIE
jgi:hypothetical protein